MTQSFNLSQLANNVNSAGKLNAAQGLTNTVSVPNGGTGQSSFANGELLIGNSNGNTLTKAKLTAGTNVTITEGPGSITIAAAGGGGGGDGGPVGGELGYALYTSGSGTWTCPTGVTKVKVTVIGGGGGGSLGSNSGKAGTGGIAVGIYTVVPGTGYAYAVGAGGNGFQGLGNAPGANGGTSSFASFCSATGGGGGGTGPESTQGVNGIGSGGIFTNSSTNTRYLSNDDNEELNIEDVGIFRGRYVRDTPLSTELPAFLSAVNWTATGIYTPGARGNEGIGGVGGVVYIEYIQVQGTATAGGGGGGGDGVPVGGELGYALYTSGSGTWTCPTGVTKVKVTVIGGGSGGWGEENYGGGGGLAVGIYTVVPGTGYAYTVGAAGNGGGLGGSGTSGGTSSFASFCSATGGTIAGISNAGSDGIGSGGTFINSNTVTPYTGDLSIFRGRSARDTPPGYPSDPGVVWTSTSPYVPGARGNPGVGGVGGVVYIEYIQVQGTATAEGSNLDYALYASGSGTWTCPPGVTKVKITCIAGGGGGVLAGSAPDFVDVPGGSGGCAIGIYSVTPGTGYTYSVGNAGNGGGFTGVSGGPSSVTGLCSATGGTGATRNYMNTSGAPGVHGVGSNGNITNSYANGQYMFNAAAGFTNPGTPSVQWNPSLHPGTGGVGERGGVGGVILIEYIRGVSIGGTSSIGDHALFTSGSGTWTCPPGVTKVKVTCIGGGGVAVAYINLPFGGLAIGVYTVTPGTGYAYTVGAGGTPSVTPIGGTSSLAGLCSATGGTTTYGYNVPGVGSGGTFTNSSVASLPFGGGSAGAGNRSFVAYAIPPFAGAIANRVSGSALVWTPTSGLIPGAAGAEWSEDNQQWEPRGGVGGAILIEYIG